MMISPAGSRVKGSEQTWQPENPSDQVANTREDRQKVNLVYEDVERSTGDCEYS